MYELRLGDFAGLIFPSHVVPDEVLFALPERAMSAYHNAWEDRHCQLNTWTDAHYWFRFQVLLSFRAPSHIQHVQAVVHSGLVIKLSYGSQEVMI